MQRITNAKTRFVKIYENVKIDVKKAKIMIPFFVINENEYFIILKRSYERKVFFYFRNLLDEICIMKVTDENDLKIKFAVTLSEHSFNKNVINIFLVFVKDFLNE